ncbi:Gos1 [Kluyveromyces lactis]|nr:Gos1 [Kluyveromyces lactis]
MSASFVTVRSKAISLESQTDSLLTKYSSFAQTTSSEPSGQETQLQEKLEKILNQRQETVESLQRIADSESNISTSKLSQLQRHRETLQDNWQTFRDIRSSIQQERNRLNLLFSVKKDLQNGASDNQNEYIQDEARRVENSHTVVDSLIDQAYETREQFMSQRVFLQRSSDRILQTLQHIPLINNVISKINTRRKKNAVILASLISICILVLFFTA